MKIAWTGVHAIVNQARVRNLFLVKAIGRSRSFTISGSGSTAWTHYDHPISIRGPQFAPIFISRWRRVELSGASDLHQMGNAWSSLARQIFIRLRSLSDNVKIKTPSRRDRGSIATRSWPDCRAIVATIKRDDGLLHRGINVTPLPTESDSSD